MTDKPLITPFEEAIRRLEEILERYRLDPGDAFIRDGVIKRFEFTYGLAHAMLRRYLEYSSAASELVDAMSFQALIRTASEQGLLLGDWSDWHGFRDMRNRTSHAYSEKIAIDVVAHIPRFLEEAQFLRDRMVERLA